MNIISKQLIKIAREYLAADYKKQKKLQEILDRQLYKDYDDNQKLNYVKLVCKHHPDLIRQVMDTISFSNNTFTIKAYTEMAKVNLQDILRDQLEDCNITRQQLKLLDPNQNKFCWNEVFDNVGYTDDYAKKIDDECNDYNDALQQLTMKYRCIDCGGIWTPRDLDYEGECPLCNGVLKGEY